MSQHAVKLSQAKQSHAKPSHVKLSHSVNAHSDLNHRSDLNHSNDYKIAEIVVTENSCATLLIPIIAAFSQYNKRWLTWITDRVPSKGQLLAYGVNLQALRLIYVNCDRDCRWLTWEALAQGNSHTVIAELNKLTGEEICALETAAAQGGTQGIIIRQR